MLYVPTNNPRLLLPMKRARKRLLVTPENTRNSAYDPEHMTFEDIQYIRSKGYVHCIQWIADPYRT